MFKLLKINFIKYYLKSNICISDSFLFINMNNKKKNLPRFKKFLNLIKIIF